MRHPIRILQAALLLALCALCLSACAAGEKAQELRAWARRGRWGQLACADLPRRGRRFDRPEPGGLDAAPIPEGAVVLGTLELRQEETRRLLDAGEPAMQTVCTLTLYEGNRRRCNGRRSPSPLNCPAADAQRLAALLPEANP